VSLIRLQPFDVSTAEGRGRERIRRAGLTAATAATARLISMATPLVTFPIVINYLGYEIYGLWATASSLIGIFTFADLGLGNGLLTALSRASGRGDLREQQALVSTTAFLLAAVALALGVVFFGSFPFLPWATFVNAKTPGAISAAATVVAVIAACFLVNLPLTTVQRAQSALQEGFQTNLWQCLGSLCGVAVVLIGVKSRLQPVLLILTLSIAPLLITGANWWYFFHRTQPSLQPKAQCFSWERGRVLLRTGIGFFVISILTSLGMGADNIIIAHVLGLKAVTIYSVPWRIGLMLGSIVNMVCLPMWAANGEALGRGDVLWVRQNTTRLMKFSVFFTAFAAIAMTAIGPPLLRLWLGADFNVSRWLLFGIGASFVLTAGASPFFMLINSAGMVATQVKMFLIFTPVVVCAKIGLALWLGSVGVPIANAVCYGLIVLPMVAMLSQKVVREKATACPVVP
jgi:O-antigen/teichoic acid export membrane protein